MTFAELRERLPDTAKDLRLNLDAIARIETLTPSQLWGSVLASALATRQADVIRAAAAEARSRLDPAAFAATYDAVRTAASLMAMNNVYYRTRHLLHDAAFDAVPARLRMQGMQSHGAPQIDFELWSVAVSAVNGCGMCLESHVGKLVKQHGVAVEVVHEAVRVAAVIFAVAATLDGEAALAG